MTVLAALKSTARIVDSVHAALREAILGGTLVPGQALSVPELARQLDVSRSPVREAVLALVADGLAVEQPRRGVAVVEIDADDLLEIHEVREGIEGQAARLCAERAGDTVLRTLDGVLARQAAIVERDDAVGWYDTNAEFHGLIAESAGNRRLAEVLLALQRQMRLGLRSVSSEREQRLRGLGEHRAILAALAGRKPQRAERLMRGHIQRTRATLAMSLGREPGVR